MYDYLCAPSVNTYVGFKESFLNFELIFLRTANIGKKDHSMYHPFVEMRQDICCFFLVIIACWSLDLGFDYHIDPPIPNNVN